jgi:hypothetical protein
MIPGKRGVIGGTLSSSDKPTNHRLSGLLMGDRERAPECDGSHD